MTGLELLGLGVGAVALYDAEEKHSFVETAMDTIKHPFSSELNLKTVLSIFVLSLAILFIWRTILRGYIME